MYRIGHSSPQAALGYQHASQRRDRIIADGISRLITRQHGDDVAEALHFAAEAVRERELPLTHPA